MGGEIQVGLRAVPTLGSICPHLAEAGRREPNHVLAECVTGRVVDFRFNERYTEIRYR